MILLYYIWLNKQLSINHINHKTISFSSESKLIKNMWLVHKIITQKALITKYNIKNTDNNNNNNTGKENSSNNNNNKNILIFHY